MGVYKMGICSLPIQCLHRGLRFRMTYKNTKVGTYSIHTKIFSVFPLSKP